MYVKLVDHKLTIIDHLIELDNEYSFEFAFTNQTTLIGVIVFENLMTTYIKNIIGEFECNEYYEYEFIKFDQPMYIIPERMFKIRLDQLRDTNVHVTNGDRLKIQLKPNGD